MQGLYILIFMQEQFLDFLENIQKRLMLFFHILIF